MVIDAFLACLFNVHYLIFLSMVHEYAYFFNEYIWKSVYYVADDLRRYGQPTDDTQVQNKWRKKTGEAP